MDRYAFTQKGKFVAWRGANPTWNYGIVIDYIHSGTGRRILNLLNEHCETGQFQIVSLYQEVGLYQLWPAVWTFHGPFPMRRG